MMKDVEKVLWRRVGVLPPALAHVFGQVQGHRALRAEQAEEAHQEARRAYAAVLEAGQRRDGEVELGLLTQAQRFQGRSQRAAESRCFGPQ